MPWVQTFRRIADVDILSNDGARELSELSGFVMESDGYAMCDFGCLVRLSDIDRLDPDLAAVLREQTPDK